MSDHYDYDAFGQILSRTDSSDSPYCQTNRWTMKALEQLTAG